MELLKEIGAFLWAVLNGWAGYCTGGIIVAVVAFWHTFRKKPIGRRFGIVLAVGFLCMAVFRAWQEQYHKANVTVSAAQYAPKLKPEIMEIYTTPVTEPDTLAVVLVARIGNSGSPSAVSRIWVSADVHGEKYESVIVFPPERYVVHCPGKPSRTFYKEDLLTAKVVVIPIPTGAIIPGFIVVEFHGVSQAMFADPGTTLQMKIEDAAGAISVETVPMSTAMRGEKGSVGELPFGMKQLEQP
jgi:hypothetical protein